MVVWNIFYCHPYFKKWSNLTNMFQMGWNHQLEEFFSNDPHDPGGIFGASNRCLAGVFKQAKSESCGQTHADQKVGELSLGIFIHTHVYTLHGTNIFHLGKRKNIFESAFKGDRQLYYHCFFFSGVRKGNTEAPACCLAVYWFWENRNCKKWQRAIAIGDICFWSKIYTP